MKLTNIKPGKWAITSGTYEGMYAVRVGKAQWEIQNEFGQLAVSDGFESLAHIRAWLSGH